MTSWPNLRVSIESSSCRAGFTGSITLTGGDGIWAGVGCVLVGKLIRDVSLLGTVPEVVDEMNPEVEKKKGLARESMKM